MASTVQNGSFHRLTIAAIISSLDNLGKILA